MKFWIITVALILSVAGLALFASGKAHQECQSKGGVYLSREGLCIDAKVLK